MLFVNAKTEIKKYELLSEETFYYKDFVSVCRHWFRAGRIYFKKLMFKKRKYMNMLLIAAIEFQRFSFYIAFCFAFYKEK